MRRRTTGRLAVARTVRVDRPYTFGIGGPKPGQAASMNASIPRGPSSMTRYWSVRSRCRPAARDQRNAVHIRASKRGHRPRSAVRVWPPADVRCRAEGSPGSHPDHRRCSEDGSRTLGPPRLRRSFMASGCRIDASGDVAADARPAGLHSFARGHGLTQRPS